MSKSKLMAFMSLPQSYTICRNTKDSHGSFSPIISVGDKIALEVEGCDIPIICYFEGLGHDPLNEDETIISIRYEDEKRKPSKVNYRMSYVTDIFIYPEELKEIELRIKEVEKNNV